MDLLLKEQFRAQMPKCHLHNKPGIRVGPYRATKIGKTVQSQPGDQMIRYPSRKISANLTDLDKRSKMIIIFEFDDFKIECHFFEAAWAALINDNWLEPKTKPPQANLACPKFQMYETFCKLTFKASSCI